MSGSFISNCHGKLSTESRSLTTAEPSTGMMSIELNLWLPCRIDDARIESWPLLAIIDSNTSAPSLALPPPPLAASRQHRVSSIPFPAGADAGAGAFAAARIARVLSLPHSCLQITQITRIMPRHATETSRNEKANTSHAIAYAFRAPCAWLSVNITRATTRRARTWTAKPRQTLQHYYNCTFGSPPPLSFALHFLAYMCEYHSLNARAHS